MNKRRIIITALTGTIALTALSISLSLAWYAGGDRVQLDFAKIDVITKDDRHLQIATANEENSFKNALTMDELDIEKSFLFYPVSTMNKDSWMQQKADSPVFYDCSNSYVAKTGEVEVDAATFGFYSQKLYLLSDLDYYVTLDMDGDEDHRATSFSNNEAANEQQADTLSKQHPEWGLTKDEIKANLNKLYNCLRMSILVKNRDFYRYYIVNPSKQAGEADVVFGGRLDTDNDGYFDTYEAEDGNHYETIFGEVVNEGGRQIARDTLYNEPEMTAQEYAAYQQEHPTSERQDPHYFGDSFNAKSRETAYTLKENNPIEYATENAMSLDDLTIVNTFVDSENVEHVEYDSPLLIPCYRGEATEIVLSFYLEGWDRDCINNTMGASFESFISFKLLRGI